MNELNKALTTIVKSYTVNTRSLRGANVKMDDTLNSASTCMYDNNKGQHCAVGQMLKPDCLKEWHDCEITNGAFSVSQAVRYIGEYGDEDVNECGDVKIRANERWLHTQLKPPFNTLSLKRLIDLQSLHDIHNYWSDNGLNSRGRDFFASILKKIEGESNGT